MPLAQPGPSWVAGSLAVGGRCGRFVDAGISEPAGPLRPPPTAQVFLRHAPQRPRRCTGTAGQGLPATSSPFQRRAEQEHPPPGKGPQPAARTPGPRTQTPPRGPTGAWSPSLRAGLRVGSPGHPAGQRGIALSRCCAVFGTYLRKEMARKRGVCKSTDGKCLEQASLQRQKLG